MMNYKMAQLLLKKFYCSWEIENVLIELIRATISTVFPLHETSLNIIIDVIDIVLIGVR